MAEPKRIRWWPGIATVILGAAAFIVIRSIEIWPYEQARSLALLGTALATTVLLLVWWLFFSRAAIALRFAVVALCALPFAFFRHRGMTGDFVPLFEYRFSRRVAPTAVGKSSATAGPRADYPQIFGPTRDTQIQGVTLESDWQKHPPQILWRQPIGAAWSGFVVVGDRAVTMEQQGEEECVTCYDVNTGKLLWKTANPGHFNTSIAGEGPRTTPTIAGNRVFTLGANGTFRCLDFESGKPIWTRELTADAGVPVPTWGFASSPLVHEGKVIVSAGGADGRSLLAYGITTGEPAWKAGTRPINYSSPFLVSLVGRPQILMFNSVAITAHDPATGAVLWEHPWGKEMPHVARPIVVGDNRVFFSSGYGVGSALLEIAPGPDGKLAANQLWKTIRFQAKFSNPAARGGHVYGVSDGIFACLDLNDGTVKWKDGRYGHGQGLMLGDQYLQMTELPGEIVLLRPTPEAANELARFRVFDAKTWNPIALSGDLLLVRNDQEAACIRLPIAKSATTK